MHCAGQASELTSCERELSQSIRHPVDGSAIRGAAPHVAALGPRHAAAPFFASGSVRLINDIILLYCLRFTVQIKLPGYPVKNLILYHDFVSYKYFRSIFLQVSGTTTSTSGRQIH